MPFDSLPPQKFQPSLIGNEGRLESGDKFNVAKQDDGSFNIFIKDQVFNVSEDEHGEIIATCHTECAGEPVNMDQCQTDLKEVLRLYHETIEAHHMMNARMDGTLDEVSTPVELGN